MHVVVQVPRLTPPIRVSFIDPAPPPPLGNGSAASAAPPQAPPAVEVAPSEPPHVVETTTLQPKPVPRVRRPAKPAAVAAVAPASAAPAPAAVASAVPGDANGVPGGVPGGLAGGIVGGTGHQLIPADQAARQPVLTKKVMPEYPSLARLRGVEGQVVLEAILSPAGDIEPDIKVVHSVPLLDAAAVAAVRQWHFRPAADQAGEPLRVTLRVPVRFVLR